MNRQYIGARYVPKFAEPIEWDNKRSYEALTIVTYLGTSYTSRIPVPVGIEINDNLYWVVTGNYNAQIDEYRKEVSELSTNVENINNKINKVYRKKRIILIADSWGDYTISGTKYSWTDNVINNLKNIDFINISTGGSGFESGSTFLNDLKNANITNKDTIDSIYVMGGTNDVVSLNSGSITESSLKNNIINFISYVKETFVNAELNIGFLGAFYNSLDDLLKVVKIYMSSTIYGCSYLNGIENCCRNTYFIDSSGIHPNIKGFTQVYEMTLNCIINKNCSILYNNIIPSFTLPTTILSVVDSPIDVSQNNNNLIITTRGFAAILSTQEQLKDSYDIVIFNDFQMPQINGTIGIIPILFTFVNGETKWINCKLIFNRSDGKLKITLINKELFNISSNLTTINFDINKILMNVF